MSTTHADCADLARNGMSAADIHARDVSAPEPPRPLTGAGVFVAVFAALWAFALSAAVVYFFFRFVAGA
jgi:hypothetical protein